MTRWAAKFVAYRQQLKDGESVGEETGSGRPKEISEGLGTGVRLSPCCVVVVALIVHAAARMGKSTSHLAFFTFYYHHHLPKVPLSRQSLPTFPHQPQILLHSLEHKHPNPHLL